MVSAVSVVAVVSVLTLIAVLYNIYRSHYVPATSDVTLLPANNGTLSHDDPWVTLNVDLDAVNDGERQARLIGVEWRYIVRHTGDPAAMTPDDLGRGTTTFTAPDHHAPVVDGLSTTRIRISVRLSIREGIRNLINDHDTLTVFAAVKVRDGRQKYTVTGNESIDTSGVTLRPG